MNRRMRGAAQEARDIFRREARPAWLCAGLAVAAISGIAVLYALKGPTAVSVADAQQPAAAARRELTLDDIPFDGRKAYEYLKQICEIGPRVTATPGMAKQQQLLTEHFTKLGGQVSLQEFKARHPLTNRTTSMANLVVEWHPDRKERILLCVHYDTRPFPDQDRANPTGTFLGANDAASGVAILMQLAHEMPKLESKFGVDFVFFDAEELVYTERDKYFLGSETFARRYRTSKPAHRYRWGVLLDLVGDADLEIEQEAHSVSWPDSRPLVAEIWGTAARLGVKEFVSRVGKQILDDHLELHAKGRIPCCDLIDTYYGPPQGDSYPFGPYWHTQQDVPENCSALSLAKVGWVLSEWLKTTK